ncbi:hypothetical protein K435DRAFT_804612 [Dendrothele bispora CBS 962.96]|uniref:Uncharacterized protein n=1 Tax=Dendrothele bispora (strain CBS 962.96) TaxID=1314807 RepID=A0A4V4HDG0_DENBC|nr:hypothetical protein K435DRAFT_804612 [Dendrothele bispora CBS 962.96]
MDDLHLEVFFCSRDDRGFSNSLPFKLHSDNSWEANRCHSKESITQPTVQNFYEEEINIVKAVCLSITRPICSQQAFSLALIFGDPKDGQAVTGVAADNTKVICHVGDIL